MNARRRIAAVLRAWAMRLDPTPRHPPLCTVWVDGVPITSSVTQQTLRIYTTG